MFTGKTLFFDLDGTLVDARVDIANAMNRVMKRLGYPEKSVEEITSYIGTGVKYLVGCSLETSDQALIDKATDLYEEEYVKQPADHTVMYPGVIDVLEHLGDKDKYILTNRYAHLAIALLDKVGIRKYFKDVFGGDNEDCIKPSVCLMSIIFKRLGIEKKDAMIIGDMDVDVMAGKNYGIKTCWVSHGLGKKEDILKLKPDYVINDITELKKIIK